MCHENPCGIPPPLNRPGLGNLGTSSLEIDQDSQILAMAPLAPPYTAIAPQIRTCASPVMFSGVSTPQIRTCASPVTLADITQQHVTWGFADRIAGESPKGAQPHYPKSRFQEQKVLFSRQGYPKFGFEK